MYINNPYHNLVPRHVSDRLHVSAGDWVVLSVQQLGDVLPRSAEHLQYPGGEV